MNTSYRLRLKEAAEALEWEFTEDRNGGVDFRNFSPAGEDFSFYVSGENIAKEVREYARTFDTEDHVAELVIARRNGFPGVPSIRELCDDADAIQEMLNELADALETVCCEEED